MDHSTTSTVILNSSFSRRSSEEEKSVIIFDTALLEQEPNLPTQFLWPQDDLVRVAQEDFQEPPIDLKGVLNGDEDAIQFAGAQIRTACSNHGVFQVINHGIDDSVIQSTYQHMDEFFNLPLSKKMATKTKMGGRRGYSGAHAHRFSCKLPWKETFSFTYNHADSSGLDVVDYVKSALGQDYEEAGFVYQKYCQEMKALALVIFELLAISLGLDRQQFSKFFEDGCSLMRGNNYPPCKNADLTFGTGPHFDPNALTILHQDQVGGLEILVDNKWQAIRPRSNAFVVNIGDTFVALCNGKYKSCLHRAVVNKERARRSLVYFVNPTEDKVVSPPRQLLLQRQEPRRYPDFTWSDMREFTQYHYRADTTTLQNFVHWLSTSHPNAPSSNSP